MARAAWWTIRYFLCLLKKSHSFCWCFVTKLIPSPKLTILLSRRGFLVNKSDDGKYVNIISILLLKYVWICVCVCVNVEALSCTVTNPSVHKPMWVCFCVFVFYSPFNRSRFSSGHVCVSWPILYKNIYYYNILSVINTYI